MAWLLSRLRHTIQINHVTLIGRPLLLSLQEPLSNGVLLLNLVHLDLSGSLLCNALSLLNLLFVVLELRVIISLLLDGLLKCLLPLLLANGLLLVLQSPDLVLRQVSLSLLGLFGDWYPQLNWDVRIAGVHHLKNVRSTQ